jgi:hypothetical protein
VTKVSKLMAATAMAAASVLALAEPGAAQVHHGRHGGGHHGGHNVNRNVNMNVNRNVNRNVNINRNVNRNVNVNRVGGYHGGVGYHGAVYRGAWVGRPYRWAPGGAIAAGAAIGVLAVGTAVAWAPPPPQPGLCWYYSDPSQRNGFWDTCP